MSTMHMHDPTTPPTTTSHDEAQKAVQTLRRFLETAAPPMPLGNPSRPQLRRPNGYIHARMFLPMGNMLERFGTVATQIYAGTHHLPVGMAMPVYFGDPLEHEQQPARDADMLDVAAEAAKPSVSVSIRLMAEAYGRAMRSDWPAQAESALRDLLFTIQGELENGLEERDRMLVEFSKLAHPEGVHAAMLAGKIARISLEQCAHTHGESAVKEVLRNAGVLPAREERTNKAACRTLSRLGYIYHGGLEWTPPLGPDGSDPPPCTAEGEANAVAEKALIPDAIRQVLTRKPAMVPTIGRKVWVFIEPGERRTITASMTVKDDQPLDATIVWVDRVSGPDTVFGFHYITVRVLDHEGEPKVLRLPLREPGGRQPNAREWAEWMPYQIGQAGGSK